MRKPRRDHNAAFKARVALETNRSERTVAQIAAHYQVHPNQVTTWKTQALESLGTIFGGTAVAEDVKEQIRELHAKTRQSTMECDLFGRRAREVPRPERQAIIERGAQLPVKRQAELLDLSRSSVYYVPRPLSERDLTLMQRIDELHLRWPFYGSRKLTIELTHEGFAVGRRAISRTANPCVFNSARSSRSANDRYRPEDPTRLIGTIPPASRNQRGPNGCDTPLANAASSLDAPAAM